MLNACPQCLSRAFKRNGYTRHGKQNHRCLDCGRQFSLEPSPFSNEGNNGNKVSLPSRLEAVLVLQETAERVT